MLQNLKGKPLTINSNNARTSKSRRTQITMQRTKPDALQHNIPCVLTMQLTKPDVAYMSSTHHAPVAHVHANGRTCCTRHAHANVCNMIKQLLQTENLGRVVARLCVVHPTVPKRALYDKVSGYCDIHLQASIAPTTAQSSLLLPRSRCCLQTPM